MAVVPVEGHLVVREGQDRTAVSLALAALVANLAAVAMGFAVYDEVGPEFLEQAFSD